MSRSHLGCVLASLALGLSPSLAGAADPPLAELFRAEVARIEAHPLQGITSASDWKSRRPELRRQLREMLGLDPIPRRDDLHATVTGVVERDDFVVEKLHFQSVPGLYVTANLYRPRTVPRPLPAILYVCGHANVEKNGVIYGNKAHYQHHAAWFAANGYVCLVLDTLQLGELPGLHHGTYRERMWWWQSRGYTPAGIEAWNGVRAIDYLCTRPEVDSSRLGVTGRSGGGATSWWVGALDDRVRAVVPVAGITDLRDHAVNPWPDGKYEEGVIEGHCDCMYFVNTYRWDFSTLAALLAPKALLIENTHHDPIFPEPGVRRIFDQVVPVFEWYGARDKLSLVVGEGGHVDSIELRHAAFAFFEKWLKETEVTPAEITEPDRAVPIEDLRALTPGHKPPDCLNAVIHESFVRQAPMPHPPKSDEEWNALRDRWLKQVRELVFRGWPEEAEAARPALEPIREDRSQGMRIGTFTFQSQPGLTLGLWSLVPEKAGPVTGVTVRVPSPNEAEAFVGWVSSLQGPGEPGPCPLISEHELGRVAGRAWVVVATRGTGSSAWPSSKETHLRRRFALLGQTLDGMRVWDVRRGLAAARALPAIGSAPVELKGMARPPRWPCGPCSSSRASVRCASWPQLLDFMRARRI